MLEYKKRFFSHHTCNQLVNLIRHHHSNKRFNRDGYYGYTIKQYEWIQTNITIAISQYESYLCTVGFLAYLFSIDKLISISSTYIILAKLQIAHLLYIDQKISENIIVPNLNCILD